MSQTLSAKTNCGTDPSKITLKSPIPIEFKKLGKEKLVRWGEMDLSKEVTPMCSMTSQSRCLPDTCFSFQNW